MTTYVDHDMQRDNDTNHWGNVVHDIHSLARQLPNILGGVAAKPISLAPTRSSDSPPLLGGDVLVMTGPWASDADEGDDTPHPAQTVIEWAQTLSGQPVWTFATATRWLADHTRWILDSPYRGEYTSDLNTVYGRLHAHLPPVVDKSHDSTLDQPQPPSIRDVIEALFLNPEHMLTRRELHDLGVKKSTVTTWRSRGLETDESGKYRAGDLLPHLDRLERDGRLEERDTRVCTVVSTDNEL